MSDIVERLRIDRWTSREESTWRKLAREAADEIERLRAGAFTDDMLRAGVKAMNESDRIQGFSTPQDPQRRTWGPPHWVMDYSEHLERPVKLWTGDSHDEMIERCEMERFRLGVNAALDRRSSAFNSTEKGR